MNKITKLVQAVAILILVVALTGCSAVSNAAPTATVVNVNAVMTSAAATAFVQLTEIAALPSPTLAPTNTATSEPVTATPGSPLQQVTPTEGAGGLPATPTQSPYEATPTKSANGLPATATAQAGNTPPAVLTLTNTPVSPLIPPGGSGSVCLNSKFITDVTIPDGTVLKSGEKFTKAWRIQNTGTCSWTAGFGLTMWATNGGPMGAHPIYFSSHDQPIRPGGTVDLYVDMVAPFKAGEYIAHFVMVSDKGTTFGGDFTVSIKVAN